MPDTSKTESGGEQKRIFDCPWCGAISRVEDAQLGGHFTCPECFDDTKLTEGNTRAGSIMAPDPDAPPADPRARREESYAPGHRTFDCPWCGAISGIDPANLGKPYACPECKKETKLTEATLRPRPVTAAPAEAPAATSRFQPLWLAGVGALALIAIAIAVFAGSGDDGAGDPQPVAKVEQPDVAPPDVAPPDVAPPDVAPPADTDTPDTDTPDTDTPDTDTPDTDTPDPGTPSSETPTEVPIDETPEVPEEAPAETPEEGPDPTPPSEPAPEVMRPPPPELVAALDAARAKLKAWEDAHPETLAVLAVARACGEIEDEASRLCEERGSSDRNPEQARAYNATLRAYVLQDSRRVGAAEWAVEHLNRDPVKPLLLESWEELNFCLSRVQATFVGGERLGQRLDPPEHVKLRRAVEEAEAALAAAVMPGGE